MDYLYNKLQNLLTSFLGTPKNDVDENGQLQYDCPCCSEQKGVQFDGKKNLEINLKLGKFHCWACGDTNGTKGNIQKLIKIYGNSIILNEYKNSIKDIKESRFYQLGNNLQNANNQSNLVNDISLPTTYEKINLKSCKNNKLISYLSERKITQDIIDRYNIGYTNNNEKESYLRNRIIIPSYDCIGELNFWVGRDFTKNEKRLKYINSKVDKTEIIFNESNINFDADIFLVEGPFDMLSTPYNTIPLLGKSLKRNSLLFQTLYKKSNGKIIIFLDGDAINDAKTIYKTLNIGRLQNNIRYIPINQLFDPSDIYTRYGKRGILKLLKANKKFHEIELSN